MEDVYLAPNNSVNCSTKRLLRLLLPTATYSFNRYFLKGFDPHLGYLSHSISIDEFFELDAWFDPKNFTRAQLADRLAKQEKKVTTQTIPRIVNLIKTNRKTV